MLAMFAGPAAADLQVTIDAGAGGSQTFVDSDADGVVAFDTTIGSVILARGQAQQVVQGITAKLAIAPVAPFSTAVFRNLSAVQQTVTVTVASATLPAPIAPPLGWDIFYNATVDDPVDATVDVPTHSVQALAGSGTIPLGTVTGAPLAAPGDVALVDHGVDLTDTSSDAWLEWTFTLGPNDEFLVPSDGGFDGESIQVNVFNQQLKCTDKMNNGARKILEAAAKSDTKCVARAAGTATDCVDATGDVKTGKKQNKLLSDFQLRCDPVPAWGVNGLSCCSGGGTNDGDICVDSSTCLGGQCAPGGCIAEAAEKGANDTTHDLFGPAVTISADARTQSCQHAVVKAVARLLVEHWKGFRVCKRDSFATISGDTDLLAACLQPEPDPKDKLTKRQTQLADTIQSKCFDKGLSGVGAIFPGICGSEPDPTFAACLAERARCRFCLSVNVADDIVPPLDCDAFDDGLANASCSP